MHAHHYTEISMWNAECYWYRDHPSHWLRTCPHSWQLCCASHSIPLGARNMSSQASQHVNDGELKWSERSGTINIRRSLWTAVPYLICHHRESTAQVTSSVIIHWFCITFGLYPSYPSSGVDIVQHRFLSFKIEWIISLNMLVRIR